VRPKVARRFPPTPHMPAPPPPPPTPQASTPPPSQLLSQPPPSPSSTSPQLSATTTFLHPVPMRLPTQTSTFLQSPPSDATCAARDASPTRSPLANGSRPGDGPSAAHGLAPASWQHCRLPPGGAGNAEGALEPRHDADYDEMHTTAKQQEAKQQEANLKQEEANLKQEEKQQPQQAKQKQEATQEQEAEAKLEEKAKQEEAELKQQLESRPMTGPASRRPSAPTTSVLRGDADTARACDAHRLAVAPMGGGRSGGDPPAGRALLRQRDPAARAAIHSPCRHATAQVPLAPAAATAGGGAGHASPAARRPEPPHAPAPPCPVLPHDQGRPLPAPLAGGGGGVAGKMLAAATEASAELVRYLIVTDQCQMYIYGAVITFSAAPMIFCRSYTRN
jgi:hypothetical protein